MTQQHPITPPPELVQQLYGLPQMRAIEKAYQAGADQELEACRHWLEVNGAPRKFIDGLLAFRRPKPPSLKEEALEELDAAILRGDCFSTSPAKDILRRAIESIPDPS